MSKVFEDNCEGVELLLHIIMNMPELKVIRARTQYKILADCTRYYKEDEKVVDAMCRIMEELIDSEKRKIVLRMLADGKLSCEKIAEYAGISIEVVNDLKNEL